MSYVPSQTSNLDHGSGCHEVGDEPNSAIESGPVKQIKYILCRGFLDAQTPNNISIVY